MKEKWDTKINQRIQANRIIKTKKGYTGNFRIEN